MNVYDPYAHTVVPLRDCEVVEADGEFAAVRSRKDGKWFAVHMPTNGTIRLSLLGEDAVRLEEAIRRREFRDKYLDACQWVRDNPETLQEAEDGAVVDPMQESISTYGKAAVNAAMLEARMRFTSAEVAHAFRHLEESDAASLEEVETVRISELAHA